MIQCALAKRHQETADVFLWCAFRCLEAMLRALLSPYPPRNFTELRVKGLLDDAAERTIVPSDLIPVFETAWRHSRMSSRVRDHKAPDYLHHVPECSRHLARALEWFFDRSPARRALSEAIKEGIEVLKNSTTVSSREHMAAERQSMLLEALEESVAERKLGIVELKESADVLSAKVAAEARAVEALQTRLGNLRSKLGELKGYPSFSVPTETKHDENKRAPRRWHWVLGLIGGLIIGGLAGVSINWGEPAETSDGQTGGQQLEPIAVLDGPEVDASISEEPVDSGNAGTEPHQERDVGAGVVSAASPGSAQCPAGMIPFRSADVRVIQPYPRRSWPPGPKAPPLAHVDAFCLDREPILVSSYEKCAAAGICRPRIECLEHPRNFPVNCVTWADATAYCGWRGATLPTVGQWERTLTHGGTVRVEPARGTWEWTNDPFPAAVLHRGPAKLNEKGSIWGYMALQKQFMPEKGGRRMCSWHKAPSTASRGNLSFRCARALFEQSEADE